MSEELVTEHSPNLSTSFSVEASAESAHIARKHVAEWASALGCLSDNDLCDLTIAVGETFANIVNHGAKDGAPVSISLKRHPHSLAIVFKYGTEPFNPTPKAPSPDDMAIGGYGLFIIRSLMDTVDYEFSTGYVRVRLEKHCQRHDPT